MRLTDLSVTNFRNLTDVKIRFHDQLNIIIGENGQGKTSILEAIYYLTITKSFRVNSEKFALQHDKEFFNISGIFRADDGEIIRLRIYYSPQEGKHVFLNDQKIERFSEVVGLAPVILLSLEDLELTYGIPQNRRKFLDILLSQVSPLYLQALQYYKKILTQRNKLLAQINGGEGSVNDLFPWDEQLIKYGAGIIHHRLGFVEFANSALSAYYDDISSTGDTISVQYKSTAGKFRSGIELKEIETAFKKNLVKSLEADVARGSSQVGPHRDDLIFLKNGYLFKAYASQGENKTLLIALKFVESDFLKQRMKESPLFLLDDIFGELDTFRIARLMTYLKDRGQTFITTTLLEKFNQSGTRTAGIFEIKQGALKP